MHFGKCAFRSRRTGNVERDHADSASAFAKCIAQMQFRKAVGNRPLEGQFVSNWVEHAGNEVEIPVKHCTEPYWRRESIILNGPVSSATSIRTY